MGICASEYMVMESLSTRRFRILLRWFSAPRAVLVRWGAEQEQLLDLDVLNPELVVKRQAWDLLELWVFEVLTLPALEMIEGSGSECLKLALRRAAIPVTGVAVFTGFTGIDRPVTAEFDLEGVVAAGARDVDVPRPAHGHAEGAAECVPAAITGRVDDLGDGAVGIDLEGVVAAVARDVDVPRPVHGHDSGGAPDWFGRQFLPGSPPCCLAPS